MRAPRVHRDSVGLATLTDRPLEGRARTRQSDASPNLEGAIHRGRSALSAPFDDTSAIEPLALMQRTTHRRGDESQSSFVGADHAFGLSSRSLRQAPSTSRPASSATRVPLS